MEVRYGTHWDHTPECLFVIRVTEDRRFVFEGLNPEHEKLSGLTTAQLKGKQPHECLPPDIAAAVTEHYRDCIAGGTPSRYEEVLDLPGGKRHWETSLVPVRDASTQRITLLLGSGRDITARVAAQRALEESEQRFRAMAETVPSILFTLLPDGTCEYVNPHFFEFSGLSNSVVPPRGYIALLHPKDRLAVSLAWERASATGTPFEIECRLRAANGAYRWFVIRLNPLSDGARVVHWFGAGADINAIKDAAAELARSHRQLESILASISDAYFALDQNWKFTRVNAQAEQWFNRSSAELTGTDFRECPKDFGFVRAIEQAMRTKAAVHVDLASYVRPSRWLEVHVYPSAEGISAFFRDVTERKSAHEALEQSKALLQSSVNALSARVAILDANGGILTTNEAWQSSASQECGGANYLDQCESSVVREGLVNVIAGAQEEFRGTYSLSGEREDQWYQVRIARFECAGIVRIVVAHDDVTDLVDARQALTNLGERLVMLQEEERRRISPELHDSTSQYLVAVGLNLMRLGQLARDVDGVKALCEESDQLLSHAQKEIRTFTYLLHPPNLDSDGLGSTIERFVDGFGRRTSLKMSVRVAPEVERASLQLKRTILRVVQEALTNVYRHASATEVTVRLSLEGSRVRLAIADDGRGMPRAWNRPMGRAVSFGVGIPGMRARVRQFGGALTIASGTRGTIVKAELPLRSGRVRGLSPKKAIGRVGGPSILKVQTGKAPHVWTPYEQSRVRTT